MNASAGKPRRAAPIAAPKKRPVQLVMAAVALVLWNGVLLWLVLFG